MNDSTIRQTKKIMYLLDSLAEPGGVERVLTDKMNYLVSNGFEITVVTYQQGNHPIIFPLHPNVKHIDTSTPFYTIYKYNRIRRIFKLTQIKKQFRRVLQKIINAEKPDVIIITTYGIPTCGIVTKLDTKAKLIVEAHAPKSMTIEGNIHSKNRIRRFIDIVYNEYQCRKVKQFDLLVLLTESSYHDWKSIAKKHIVIPNPVTYFPESISHNTTPLKRIIAAGRLHPQKGYDRLIEAYAMISNQCPEWHVDIFGIGDEKQYLIDLIKYKKMQNKIFIHPATPKIYEEYSRSDFFVLSSRFEGLPLVLIEAMSSGLPCLSFRCKYGPEDIIEDGKNGILVEDGNIQQLAEKILWMCNHEKERNIMGIQARKTSEKYKKENIMPKWINLFNTLPQ